MKAQKRPMRISDAARIFRVLSGLATVRDMADTMPAERVGWEQANTFERWLAVNNIKLFEEVLR